MKRKALILVLALAALMASSPSAGAQEQYNDPFQWKKCNASVDFNLKITAARNMRCKSAKRVMRRFDGSIKRRFDAPSGFRCKLVRGRVISGVWRCRKGETKAFRFAFGD